MDRFDYDVVVVGAGPNGLAAAIKLQQEGLAVLLLEGAGEPGGGMRSAGLTLPGFTHDICSAIHPLAAGSPFFSSLPLHAFGLAFIYPPLAAAHPFDNGTAAVLERSISKTAGRLGTDDGSYRRIFEPLVRDWPLIADDVLGPLHFPCMPLHMASFGLKAMASAASFARIFEHKPARGLWAGMAAHALQPLTNAATSAIALVLMIAGHIRGWPMPKGGAQALCNALVSYFLSLGGEMRTGFKVGSLRQLPTARAVLLDVTPRQLLEIAGDDLSPLYRWQLRRYKYGMGVFKMDWALDGPIPWKAPECRLAGTVHLGNTFEEINASESATAGGLHPERPFVLLAQPTVFDDTRAPHGKHTAWAYCHVPNGSATDMSLAIENQVERFAPGFKDLIIARHSFNTAGMQGYNPNYVGGDINGGEGNLRQLFTRPVLRLSPYRTSMKGVYLCSSSTPPGGGVHGMCGFHAAQQALRDVFGIKAERALTFCRQYQ